MKPTFNDKLIAYLTLASGISISCVAEFYSIMGLIAIYPAAVLPIIIMGVVLGIGKLSATVWLKQSWEWAPRWLKLYILPAIAALMMITSIGVFGFLSKAHSDQNLVSGDVQSKIAIYDEKIKTAKENIESNRKQLKQMDEAVDQVMARSQDEKGADKANAIRKSQSRDRVALAKDIEANQKLVIQLNDEAAPIRAEVRKVEAEVGPIKYIAAFIYGSNPDANILEKAVSWVSILIVIVLDPLAIVLLLASQYNFQRFSQLEKQIEEELKTDFEGVRAKDGSWVQTGPAFKYRAPVEEADIEEPRYEPDNGPLTEEEIEHIRELARNDLPTGKVIKKDELFSIDQIKQSADKFIEAFKENEYKEVVVPTVETIAQAPVPTLVKITDASKIVRNKVFPKIVPPVVEETPLPTRPPGSPPDHEDGDYVVINGVRYHKKAAPESYVQNEEQQESSLWSNTVSNTAGQPITPEQYVDAVKKASEQ